MLFRSLAKLFENRPDVKIARPQKMAELRIRDLDPSTTSEEVVQAIVEAGGCSPTDVKVGELRSSQRGQWTIWVRCPLAAANKVAAAGRLRLAFVQARVDLLDARPLHCYKCMERGHVRVNCPNTDVDRSGCCYRCGDTEIGRAHV